MAAVFIDIYYLYVLPLHYFRFVILCEHRCDISNSTVALCFSFCILVCNYYIFIYGWDYMMRFLYICAHSGFTGKFTWENFIAVAIY